MKESRVRKWELEWKKRESEWEVENGWERESGSKSELERELE